MLGQPTKPSGCWRRLSKRCFPFPGAAVSRQAEKKCRVMRDALALVHERQRWRMRQAHNCMSAAIKRPSLAGWPFLLWAREDLNLRPLGCEPSALTTELRARKRRLTRHGLIFDKEGRPSQIFALCTESEPKRRKE